MAFEFGAATKVDETRLGQLGHAIRRTGRPVALIVLGTDVHGGHLALLRAASRLRGVVSVVALRRAPDEELTKMLASCGADAVYVPAGAAEAPGGAAAPGTAEATSVAATPAVPTRPRTLVVPEDHGLEPVEERAHELTRIVSLVGVSSASDVFLGEKDFELLIDVQHAVTDLHLGARVHGVPTVRMPDGLALSLRNSRVPEEDRERAVALSAALTAGAHVAEKGADAVVEIAGDVLAAAGVHPEYLELRSHLLGEAPVEGEARLLVAATFGGVRLIDNVGVPVGIGFRGLAERSG
ncbi:hypothetical protein CATYP_09080 [Corynebacterium atypicum]|uniref:pantoate--beta-alanine ligase (AMP-forming) n=1 Tax=Corynebacterium atypicum TaxID=191610 RepID=A0ABN4DGK4_9CORY|nr:pantoate--beta-alanine ligase [Corynebacterium atypicum]AIG64687.1 hypothetical protein CATYP_09080 [Corynebacterium atypicum]